MRTIEETSAVVYRKSYIWCFYRNNYSLVFFNVNISDASILDLHIHLIEHPEGGNYFYNQDLKTAFPKQSCDSIDDVTKLTINMVSKETQTDDIDVCFIKREAIEDTNESPEAYLENESYGRNTEPTEMEPAEIEVKVLINDEITSTNTTEQMYDGIEHVYDMETDSYHRHTGTVDDVSVERDASRQFSITPSKIEIGQGEVLHVREAIQLYENQEDITPTEETSVDGWDEQECKMKLIEKTGTKNMRKGRKDARRNAKGRLFGGNNSIESMTATNSGLNIPRIKTGTKKNVSAKKRKGKGRHNNLKVTETHCAKETINVNKMINERKVEIYNQLNVSKVITRSKRKCNERKVTRMAGGNSSDNITDDGNKIIHAHHSKQDNKTEIDKCLNVSKEHTAIKGEPTSSCKFKDNSKNRSQKQTDTMIVDTEQFSEETMSGYDVSQNTKNFPCRMCGVTCDTRMHLEKHIEDKHYHCYELQCDKCFVPFVDDDEFPNHNCSISFVLTHVCLSCNDGIEFRFKSNLVRHLKREHNNTFPVICNVCHRHLVSELDRRRHMFQQHNALRDCKTCNKHFHTLMQLEDHELNVHVGDARYKCHLCEKSYKTKTTLIHHMSEHGIELKLKYFCTECNKGFYRKKEFILHNRRHTGEKPFVCDQCGDTFLISGSLNRHRKYKHTFEKQFKCTMCSKSFVTNGGLQRHERVHRKITPFSCEYCGKLFGNNWNLKAHRRQHTGETPYKCFKCGHGFAHNVVRKTHESKCEGRS